MARNFQNLRNDKRNGKQFAYLLDSISNPETGESYKSDEEAIREAWTQFRKEFNHDYNRKLYPNYRGIARDFGDQLTGVKPQQWKIFRGGVIRPCWTSGSGRYCQNMDYSRDICAVLDALRVNYETGNDAPRGGATGKYIKIITKLERNEN